MGTDDEYGGDGSGLFDSDRSWDIESFLDYSEEQEDWLEQELERIDDQLEKRDELHDKLVSEFKWKIDLYADRIDQLTGKWHGESEKLEQVKHRLHAYYEALREEYVEHWRDKQRLQDERRQVLRELDRVRSDYLSDI